MEKKRCQNFGPVGKKKSKHSSEKILKIMKKKFRKKLERVFRRSKKRPKSVWNKLLLQIFKPVTHRLPDCGDSTLSYYSRSLEYRLAFCYVDKLTKLWVSWVSCVIFGEKYILEIPSTDEKLSNKTLMEEVKPIVLQKIENLRILGYIKNSSFFGIFGLSGFQCRDQNLLLFSRLFLCG